jgi:hypothetical protein
MGQRRDGQRRDPVALITAHHYFNNEEAMKLQIFAILGMFACTAVSAEIVPPFDSDGCVPGYNAQGQFTDENGKVLDGQGWIATVERTVVTATGERVFLHKPCLGLLAGDNVLTAGLIAGVLIVGLATGGTSSTNGTN